jgi:hypothetical protein
MDVVLECRHFVVMSDGSASFHVVDVSALSVHVALLSWVRPNQYDPLPRPHSTTPSSQAVLPLGKELMYQS